MKNKGFLIYAFNTNIINYGKIANICAMLIKYHLNYPVTIVKDNLTIIDEKYFNTIITINKSELSLKEKWRNNEKVEYYIASQYEETICIDCDYLLFNDNLKCFFDSTEDIYLCKNVEDINTEANPYLKKPINNSSIEMIWATLYYFNKSKKSKLFNDLLNIIIKHYNYYYKLYNILDNTYRNDFVFSIANHIFNLKKNNINLNFFPSPISFCFHEMKIDEVLSNGLILLNNDKSNYIELNNLSLHILNKMSIIDHYENFKKMFGK